jgi:hypothetical protein
MAAAVEAAEPEHANLAAGDIWLDAAVMGYLQRREFPAGIHTAEQRRVERRARRSNMTGGALYQHMPDTTTRRVPLPAERKALVELTHQRCGHFGEKMQGRRDLTVGVSVWDFEYFNSISRRRLVVQLHPRGAAVPH